METFFANLMVIGSLGTSVILLLHANQSWYAPSHDEKKFVRLASRLVGFDEKLVRLENEEIERQKKQEQ